MPDLNDFHKYKIVTENSKNTSRGENGGFGCGWSVIVIVAIMLVYFIFSGASWEAIDSLLGLGFLAFVVVRWLFK